MFEPQIISLGPVYLPLSWIALLLLTLTTVWLAERWSPARHRIKGTVSDWMPTVLLIVLLVYKFGPALFNLKQVLQNPAFLLYSSGTGLSLVLAILLAGSWLGWKVMRSAVPWETVDVLAIAALLTTVIYLSLFKDYGATTTAWWGWRGVDYHYHPLNVYRLGLLLPLLIWLLKSWKTLDSGLAFIRTALWSGIVFTVTTFFDDQVGRVVLGLVPVQWAGIILALIGLVFTIIKDR